jgi:hypothetical protein
VALAINRQSLNHASTLPTPLIINYREPGSCDISATLEVVWSATLSKSHVR